MVDRMKTTLILPDPLAARLKAAAETQGRTMSDVVVEALHVLLDAPEPVRPRFRLPTFDLGIPAVDIANRDALHDLFDHDAGD